MSGREQHRLHEAQLQEEIEELRSDLGETVEALVHKVDLPTQAKERGNEFKGQVLARSGELRDRAVEVAERAREGVSQAPKERWVELACAGLALVAVMVIVRRVRAA